VIFLIYPGNAAAIFATFQCLSLDDGTRWLRVDLSINCDGSQHQLMTYYAWFMLVIYPIGVPLYYYATLRRHSRLIDELRNIQQLRIGLIDHARAERHCKDSVVTSPTASKPWVVLKKEEAKLPFSLRKRLDDLELQEKEGRKKLPGHINKLLKGYELRVWWFEIFECARKLAVACLPVFFTPSGSVSQLLFGLIVCFVCFGAYVHFDPFEDRHNDLVARVCQAQIFFSLLCSVAFKYDPATKADGTNLGILLVVLWSLPIGLAAILLTPAPSLLGEAKDWIDDNIGGRVDHWLSRSRDMLTQSTLEVRRVTTARFGSVIATDTALSSVDIQISSSADNRSFEAFRDSKLFSDALPPPPPTEEPAWLREAEVTVARQQGAVGAVECVNTGELESVAPVAARESVTEPNPHASLTITSSSLSGSSLSPRASLAIESLPASKPPSHADGELPAAG